MMKRYLLFNDGALCSVLFGVQLSINYIWTNSAVYADQCAHTFHAYALTLVSFSFPTLHTKDPTHKATHRPRL